jgi:DNA invertase Pin-like site-specific DNA recombinase
MPKAYSYARFSSEKQSGNDSLRRQIDKAEAFVIRTQAQYGLELDTDRRLSDPAMSAYKGTNLKRGALAAFITAAENGLIEEGSFLLIESFDRLSRQESATSLRLLLDLIDNGITVVTLIDERVYSKETIRGMDGTFTLMQSLVTMARAHEESATKGMRVREVWAKKMERVREGVQLTKRVPFWMNQDRSLRDEKVKLVQRIFKLHSEGIGDTRLVKLLNGEKVPTPSNKGIWQASTIRKLITGKQVLGILQTADGKSHEGYFPAIITDEEWLKANVMTGSGRATKAATTPKPLAGLVRCSCGSTMRHQSRTGRVRKDGTRNRWDYLVCSTASSGAGCVFVGIPQETVLERLTSELPWLLHSALEWDDNTTELEKTGAILRMAEEDAIRAYEAFKISRTTLARGRLIETEKHVEQLKKEFVSLQQAGSSIGNNLIRTLLQAPRVNDSAWWRQLMKSVTIDTITKTITLGFHNGKSFNLPIDPLQHDKSVINAADLWEEIKIEHNRKKLKS